MNRSGALLILAIAAVLLAVSAAPSRPAPAQPRAHLALIQLAAANPATQVAVIVQHTDAQTTTAAIHALGGSITSELQLINAIAARMPAGAALTLARAPGIRWIAPDAPIISTSKASPCRKCSVEQQAQQALLAAFPHATGATRLWAESSGALQGQGITVAVVDSGINPSPDLATPDASASRIIANVALTAASTSMNTGDAWGHGTHVAGIIGGNGAASLGAQSGMAPQVNLINVKVGDDRKGVTTADVIAGLQWVYDNAERYNIRVVNLSVSSTIAESYHSSALNAAVELIWFKGIVVVVAGGNNGLTNAGILYPPANDPFVIAVGALDDRGTATVEDDGLAPFSAFGSTMDGIAKPDLVAPGTNIVSLLAGPQAILARSHPDHFVDGFHNAQNAYFRMSGTSMSSAVVAGGIALLLQDEPGLTPDQVKYRLMATARPVNDQGAGAGALDIYAAVHGVTSEYANQDVVISRMLWSDDTPVAWGAANWGAANWGAANWGAANWGAANWGSLDWNN